MQKEELLHLHMLMVTVKKYYETVTGDAITTNKYDSLLISPVHIHKNKNSHKEALLTLAEELVERFGDSHGLYSEYQNKSSPVIAIKP